MPPTTRSQTQRESNFGQDSDQESDGSDASVDDDDRREARVVVRSPITDISYDISDLDRETQKEVRQLFRTKPGEQPSQFVLQGCRAHVEHDSHFYAFEMLETVRVNYHTAGHDSGSTEHFGPDGYPAEMGHPYEKISEFHLDQLATSLHCDIIPHDSTTEVNPAHLQAVREILASVEEPDLDDYACDRFRPDIFDNPQAIPGDGALISYEDLTHTVANMLIENKEFFAYFLRLLEPSSKARDPFRKIQQRIDRVLGDLDAFSRDPSGTSVSRSATEGNPDVPWAAAHIERAVSMIQTLLQNRSYAPSSSTERASAARTLVRILHAIVLYWNRDVTYSPATITSTSNSSASPLPTQTATAPNLNETNLYHRLIGGKTHGSSAFVIDVLAQLPEQNQWIETLEEIEDQLGAYAPPAGYVGRLRDLILRMRSTRPAPVPEAHTSGPSRRGDGSTAGNKRSGGGGNGRQGGAKRVK
ncbi:putative swim zinc finger family protein [Diaporthe ampelina]|uniref:Putative swim zinc finger family protein n=1 Tax=Diaporthe ampelina TaxID=1214573 RepID=A0A0G2HUF1_9PEZI|nr:putative swim zinc finger family protein [Diaporthe ampelina]